MYRVQEEKGCLLQGVQGRLTSIWMPARLSASGEMLLPAAADWTPSTLSDGGQLCRDSVDESALLSFAALPATHAGLDADVISPQGETAGTAKLASLWVFKVV